MTASKSPLRAKVLSRLKRGRERGQNGWLAVVGKTRKRWRGHFWAYELQADGREIRKHKSLVLGFRTEMTRQQAKDALRQVILKRSELKRDRPTTAVTFGQFWRERFLPMHKQRWKASSRETQIYNVERYCVQLLENSPLVEIERFQLQMIANRLAEEYSHSVVSKFIIWSRAILEEAVDQEFLSKNPARKLTRPETRPENKRYLALEEVPLVLYRLPFREQLILQMGRNRMSRRAT